MNHKSAREATSITAPLSRKRARIEDTNSTSGWFNHVTKTRKHTNLPFKEKTTFAEGMLKTTTVRPDILPLTDITSRDPRHCLVDQSNAREVGDRLTNPRENSTSSSPTKNDSDVIDAEKTQQIEEKSSKTVTYVNNLFSPVNKLQAIPMTVDELQRRTQYPEFFGRSELVSYLRHSKTTGNELISKYNLRPAECRSKLNVLSRLCEHEAVALANGIYKVNNDYFPSSYVADTMKEVMNRDEATQDDNDDSNTECGVKETVTNTIDLLQNLKHLLKDPKEELADDLDIFERVTHTFGCQNIVNHISFIEGFLEELKTKL